MFFFFFNYTATTEIYTLSLHDALPISRMVADTRHIKRSAPVTETFAAFTPRMAKAATQAREEQARSEEHTSELQSLRHLVCRLLLEKKKKKKQQEENTHKNDR